MEGSPDPVGAFIRCALTAELSAVETKLLTNEVARRSGVGVKVVEASLKAARQEQRERRAEEAHQRRLAERTDPRPQLPAPPSDAPWMPEMDAINEVLSRSSAALPPMRDIDDAVTAGSQAPGPEHARLQISKPRGGLKDD